MVEDSELRASTIILLFNLYLFHLNESVIVLNIVLQLRVIVYITFKIRFKSHVNHVGSSEEYSGRGSDTFIFLFIKSMWMNSIADGKNREFEPTAACIRFSRISNSWGTYSP